MRISLDTLKIIDQKAAANEISRTELNNQMITYALEIMEDPPQVEQQNEK